ncbi:hypothetical protein B4N89_27925 [Embleya scabrispora]|uniref:CBM-cenC domain-containing protein n=1 Tax=Embleya scabrispora TaxID=159449 RepID=A0A1T3P576_9ACTN|nr:hypothetical protein [Embleya scabrispora]OPC84247.1 hypothetical protein B4N89_27925 [Embleya scabrispora]
MAISTNLLDANTSGFETNIGTWTAGSNTTAARVTGVWYTGAACMRLTATANGSVVATTGAVPITALSEYLAFAFTANTAAVAGRTVSLTLTWLNASNATVGTSVGTTPTAMPASTAWVTPPTFVDAVAPATATQVKLTVTVTGMLAGGQILVDEVGLGPPLLQSGNLLFYNDQSIEMDASGWTASVNCTAARSSAQFVEGWYSLAVTATASGDVQVRSVATPAVAAGTEYFGYFWIRTPIALTVQADLWWYDASNAQVGTTSTTTVTAVTTWQRLGVAAKPPATATKVRLVVRPQATAAAQVVYVDQMTIRTAPFSVAGNLLAFGVESMECDLTGWAAGANASIARTTAQASAGFWSMEVTTPAAGQGRAQTTALVPVVAGTYYLAKQSYRSATAGAMWTDIDWYASDGVTWLGNAGPDRDLGLTPGSWWSNTIGRKAPPGAAWARVVSLPQSTLAGQVWWVDAVGLSVGTPPYELTAHPETGSATLVINNATSSGATSITVHRVDPDGTRSPVRGYGGDLENVAVPGAVMVVTDYEVPLGAEIHYEYIRHAPGPPAVDYSTGTTGIVVAPPADPAYVWLSDPGQPARSIRLMIEKPPDWTFGIERAVYRVRGRADPIVRSDVRRTPEGDLAAYTWTTSDDTQLRFTLETGHVLLLRARPGWGLDYQYVSVGSVQSPRVVQMGSEAGRRWTLPLTVVARPTGGMVGSASRTWQTVKDDATATTWAAVLAKYSTWLDVLQGV